MFAQQCVKIANIHIQSIHGHTVFKLDKELRIKEHYYT